MSLMLAESFQTQPKTDNQNPSLIPNYTTDSLGWNLTVKYAKESRMQCANEH